MNTVYRGTIYHQRMSPVEHHFTYPVFFVGLDVDSIPDTRLFHYNRSGVMSLRDADHLTRGDASIAGKCRRFMGPDLHRIRMVTVPRLLGYVFNPVTFYLGYDKNNELRAMAAEVNNTFGERHVYVANELTRGDDGSIHATKPKQFHVSPFNDRQGDYHFRVDERGGELAIHVDIVRNGTTVFKSGMVGRSALPFTDRTLWGCLLRFPLQNILTLPRIHAQAARLYFQKKLRYYPKPAPCSDMTIQTPPPNLIERIGIRLFRKLLSRLQFGQLEFTMPDGQMSRYGVAGTGPDAAITVTDYAFFRRILLDGDIGLGEAYMYGQWETPDLTAVVAYLIRNRDVLDNGEFWTARWKWLQHRIAHTKRSNTKSRSPDNISAHYDLSNEFFALFLDPTMMYSAAVFASPDEPLESAQIRRMQMLIEKLAVTPDHHVLEIGSGWGGFAIELAKTTGCRVTSITISQEQLILARQRVREAGLDGRVQIEFCDYRDVRGAFDRVVSIEMLEAVGHEHFDDYFGAIDRVLKPGGRAVIQVITMPQDRYEDYRNSVDWIQKYIFPGGLVPSVEALQSSMARISKLAITGMEDIGPHYATTLRRWSERLAGKRDQLIAMGYDDVFYRTWQYYFSYCEAGFVTKALGDQHMIIERKG